MPRGLGVEMGIMPVRAGGDVQTPESDMGTGNLHPEKLLLRKQNLETMILHLMNTEGMSHTAAAVRAREILGLKR